MTPFRLIVNYAVFYKFPVIFLDVGGAGKGRRVSSVPLNYYITGRAPICTNLVRMLAFVTCPFFVFQQKNPQNTQERHPQKEG